MVGWLVELNAIFINLGLHLCLAATVGRDNKVNHNINYELTTGESHYMKIDSFFTRPKLKILVLFSLRVIHNTVEQL